MQRGQIYRRHGSWHLRYRVDGKRISQRLVPYNDEFRTLKSVQTFADKILNSLGTNQTSSGLQTIQQFIELSYLPYAEQHKRPSTVKGYRNLYNRNIAPRVSGIRIHSFRTVDAQRLLDTIAANTGLSHRSLIHIKTFLSAVFAYARRTGVLDTNPIVGTEIPRGKPSEPTYAYSPDEIKTMLRILKSTARVAVTVAAYTGLSLSELRGLKWEDISEEQLVVRRTVWHRIEGPTKTFARNAPVPLLPIVRKTLVEHHGNNPNTAFVFESYDGRPLDLATMGSKGIKKSLEGSGVDWHGWHALRRSLATTLHALGVQDKTIQAIMRHSSLAVTMSHYVKSLPAASVDAMMELGKQK